jgi:Trypsin-like peptidase domain
VSAAADEPHLDTTRSERAVEVILDRGQLAEDQAPRYSVGSGHLVGGARVLTAAHVLGEGRITVRTVSGKDYSAVRIAVDAIDDLALLEIRDPAFLPGPPPVAFGDVDRTSDDPVERCSAVGFPRFGERHDRETGRVVRDTAHLRGVIPPRSHLVGGRLEFEVTATPRSLPQLVQGASEWEGISGSAVCAHHPGHGLVLVGVIVDHHRPRGSSSLTVVPVSTVMRDEGWRVQLGLGAAAGFVRLPAVLEIPPSPYRATVRELAQRTGQLLGREQELARLAHFARGRTHLGYLWLIGPKWWGKTALAASSSTTRRPTSTWSGTS